MKPYETSTFGLFSITKNNKMLIKMHFLNRAYSTLSENVYF